MNLGLGLHLAGATVGLAVGWGGKPVQFRCYDWGWDTSRVFHQELVQFMQPYRWQEVSFLAVTRGPGAFTTLRLGLVTARILAQELNIPLFALSTLGVASFTIPEPVAVAWPAGADWVYGGIYDQGKVLQPDQVFTPTQWQDVIQNWPEPLRILDNVHHQAPADQLLHWAEQLWQNGARPHWSAAEPFYGRSPVNDYKTDAKPVANPEAGQS